MKKKTEPLSTTNVIEMADGEIIGLISFPNTTAGRKAAELRFTKLCADNTEATPFEILEGLDDDYLEESGWEVRIVTSNEMDPDKDVPAPSEDVDGEDE